MNYLTMCNTVPQTRTEGNVSKPSVSRIENNVYSIPLFHNEFYENLQQSACRTLSDVPHICRHHVRNEADRDNDPVPCNNVRYTPETWRRNVSRDAVVTCRDSGTESLNMDNDITHQPPPYFNRTRNACVSNITSQTQSNKSYKLRMRNVVIMFIIGILFGIATSSVVWLTVDRLKFNDIHCSVENSVTINKDSDSITSTRSDEFDTNPTTTVSRDLSPGAADITTTQTLDNYTHNSKHSTAVPTSPDHYSPAPQYSPVSSVQTTNVDDMETTMGDSITSTPIQTTSPTLTKQTTSTVGSPISSSSLFSSPVTSTPTVVSTSPSTSRITEGSVTSPIRSSSTDLPSSDSWMTDTSVTTNYGSSVGTDDNTDSPAAEGLSQTTAETNIEPGGHVYHRWGRSDCPAYSILLYQGFVVGGHYIHYGGASNSLCLPSRPTWGNYNDDVQSDRNLIHVTEYESSDTAFNNIMGKSLHNKNVPCAVCEATGRYTHVMIPARTQCDHGWYREYIGYLMGGSFEHPHGKSVICVDADPQVVPGTEANENGNLLYFVEYRGTNTEHYVNGRELPCVVCTR